MDRVPISEVQESEQVKEAPETVGSQPVDTTVEEMRDMRNLSLLFGFDGDNFEGNLGKAMSVWDWATRNSADSTEALLKIKDIIRNTGGTKKELLSKVYVWTSLQGQIESLQREQSVLEE